MLITCPHCGPRDVGEFSYQGDANRVRPDPLSNDPQAWTDYVFQRSNAAGPHREYWQHAGGCRAHLAVVRDTTTHEIKSVEYARAAPAAAVPAPKAAKPAAKAVPRAAKASPSGTVAKAPAAKRTAKPVSRSRKKPA